MMARSQMQMNPREPTSDSRQPETISTKSEAASGIAGTAMTKISPLLHIRDQYISDRCTELSDLMTKCKKWAKRDPELGAHLATYINVLILGILEECVEHLVRERARLPGDREIKNYISKDIAERLRNPTYQKICNVLLQFSEAYRDEFRRTFSADSLEAAALKSIITNKTNVAHYGLANLSLSMNDVGVHFNGIVKMLIKLEDLLIVNP